jgi:hypothetical protein
MKLISNGICRRRYKVQTKIKRWFLKMRNRLKKAFPVILASIFIAGSLAAAQDTAAMKAHLEEVRAERLKVERDYDVRLSAIHKESEEKIAKVKTDYRLAFKECLRERDEKENSLYAEYQGRVKPLLKEEKELIKLVGPGEAMNFAKPMSRARKAE